MTPVTGNHDTYGFKHPESPEELIISFFMGIQTSNIRKNTLITTQSSKIGIEFPTLPIARGTFLSYNF